MFKRLKDLDIHSLYLFEFINHFKVEFFTKCGKKQEITTILFRFKSKHTKQTFILDCSKKNFIMLIHNPD